MTGGALARAAQSLAGVRFRLHGRDPATGLDCVGLLEAALRLAGRDCTLPRGYPLRVIASADWLPDVARWGFAPAAGLARPGDVVLIAPAAGQVHLAIAAGDGAWVHAHAGLRRVVIAPQRPDGTLLHHWRLTPAS